MLIGDKGESGGRRWEVVCLADSAIPTSLNVRRLAGGKISGIRIIYQSQGQSLGRWPDLPSGHFRTVSTSDAGWCPDFRNPDLWTVPRSDAGLCILLIQGFA